MPSLPPIIKITVLRLVIPTLLFAACVIRPSLMSLIYGVLACVALAISIPSHGGPGVGARYFMLVSLVVGILCFVAQLTLQIYVIAEAAAVDRIGPCGNASELILRAFGLQQLSPSNPGQSARIVLPEILAFLASLIGVGVIIVCDTSLPDQSEAVTETPQSSFPFLGDAMARNRIWLTIIGGSELIVVLMAAMTGTVQPCLLSLVYYMYFLVIMLWWGAHKPLNRGFTDPLKIILAVFCVLHLALIYLYQIPGIQDYIHDKSLVARLLGLTRLFVSDCPNPWQLHTIAGTKWWKYAHPGFILAFYIILVVQRRCVGATNRPRSPKLLDASRDDASSVHEELLTGEQTSAPPAIRGFSILNEGEGVYGIIAKFITTILKHCYALALVTMMTWALIYHTWLTFVWLILACVIWVYPRSQNLYFTVAPVIILYAIFLLLKQYVFSLDLKDSELANDGDKYTLFRQIGFRKEIENPWRILWIQSALALPFFVTWRLSNREKARRNDPSYGTFGNQPGDGSGLSLTANSTFVGHLLCKYWIYMVGLVLLLISIRVNVYLYSIGYMIFFVVLIAALVVSFRVVRGILFVFLTLLLLYSSLVLFWIYLYQFDGIPEWWTNTTHLASDVTKDLGLVRDQNPGDLLYRLLSPISFMVVCAIQLKFFNSTFLKITGVDGNFINDDVNNVKVHVENDEDKPERKWYMRYLDDAQAFWLQGVAIAWRLAELHMRKVVSLALILVAVYEVCLVNVPLVVLVCLMTLIPVLYGVGCLLSTVWLGLIIVVKMIFQLTSVADRVHSSVLWANESCSMSSDSCDLQFLENVTSSHPLTYSEWAGVEKVARISDHLAWYIVAVVILAVDSVVQARQWWYRKVSNVGDPANNVPFPEITRQHADQSTVKCIQYLANYFFYKFGVEVCFVTTMIVIGIRMDLMALIYAVCLFGLFAVSRRTQSILWYPYAILLTLLLPLQYLSALGLPPMTCAEYPWIQKASTLSCTQQLNLVIWSYLPAYVTSPNAYFLIADFFQLLFVCYQLFVFRIERAEGVNYEGGDNTQTHLNQGIAHNTNPMYDFITHKRCSLDYLKAGVFQYFQWITLVMVFVAGLGGVSLFALGYLIAAFLFLWRGNDLYLKPIHTVIKKWRTIVYLSITIVLLKVALQLVGCGFSNWMNVNVCWLNQLLSITCLRGKIGDVDNDVCLVDASEADVTYDVLCFVFLVIQLRILGSDYFKHVVVEFRAQKVLSSRGAVLINQLTRKELREQEDYEDKIFESIRTRMQAIKERYDKQVQQGHAGPEPGTYGEVSDIGSVSSECETITMPFIDDCSSISSPWLFDKDGKLKSAAKRAGDYFMFDYDPDEDDALIVDPKDQPAPFDPELEHQAGLDPLQLVHAAMNADDLREVNREADRQRQTSLDAEDGPPPFVEDDDDVIDLATSKTPVQRRASKKDVDGDDVSVSSGDTPEAAAAPGFVKRLLISVLDFCSAKFNRMSRDYRYVEYVLKREKSKLKEEWHELLGDLTKSTHELRKEWVEGELGRSVREVKNDEDLERLEGEVSKVKDNSILRFFLAVWNLMVANTDLMCFLVMAANHVTNASVLSLPLPLMAFLWGTLCNPRPPKFFWIVVISYTEAVVIVKFMFQFGFFPWNGQEANVNPLWAPRIMGIEKRAYFAAWDVVLLIVLFFHRYMLRRMGLWKDAKHLNSTEEVDADAVFENGIADSEQEDSKQSIELQDINVKEINPSTDEIRGEEEEDKGRSKYTGGCAAFCYNLLRPAFRYIRDLYPWMFLCDFVCILIIIFGFKAFYVSSSSGDVLADIQSSRVPLPFVLMLLLMVTLIVIDRAIYLRKSVFAKLIFQIVLVLGLHVWIFFLLPQMTGTSTTVNAVAQVWYMIKCIYLLFSAWQIRNGYPSRILGNLLTRSYSLVSSVLFTGFMLIPFVFEIRTIIDWVWTETSMPIFDFFNMENYYATIYKLKCSRKMEADFPAPRGQPKGNMVKWFMGIPLLVIIIGCVFLPLLLFALLNYIGTFLTPDSVKFSVVIQGYPPLYTMTSQGWWIEGLDDDRYAELYNIYNKDRQSVAFLRDYNQADTRAVFFQKASMVAWDISPPGRTSLLSVFSKTMNFKKHVEKGKHNDALRHNSSDSPDINIEIYWEFRRPAEKITEAAKVHSGGREIKLTSKQIDKLAKIVNGSYTEKLELKDVIPPYLLIPETGETSVVKTLLNYAYNHLIGSDDPKSSRRGPEATYMDLTLQLNETGSSYAGGPNVEFWSIYATPQPKYILPIPKNYESTGLQIVTFVDKVFPSAFKSFTGGGIIGVYITLVLVVGRAFRGIIVNDPLGVIVSEIPYPDRLLKICLDLYLVREAKDFFLEQDLFSRLIFLFRSPETLIKWTKPPKAKME